MLRLRDLDVGYAGKTGVVVGAINAEVDRCAFICILGRNGAGKSTLMRTIAGLQPPLAGGAELGQEEIQSMGASTRARRISVVLTERSFSPALRVEDVVSLGRQPFTNWQGRISADDSRIVEQSLTDAGASSFRGRYFDDLSDGERQRVLIARAIAQTAKLMVLDEITAFLDLPGRVEVMASLRRHARATGTAVLLSSHDLDLSLQLADQVWLVDGGRLLTGAPQELVEQGAITEAFDTPDVVFSPSEQRFRLRPAL